MLKLNKLLRNYLTGENVHEFYQARREAIKKSHAEYEKSALLETYIHESLPLSFQTIIPTALEGFTLGYAIATRDAHLLPPVLFMAESMRIIGLGIFSPLERTLKKAQEKIHQKINAIRNNIKTYS